MVETKYFKMDKSIVTKGMMFDFRIFFPTNSNKTMKLFKEKNSIIIDSDLLRLGDSSTLYINSEEQKDYKIYLKEMLDNRAAKEVSNSQNNKELETKPLSFDEASKIIYTKAVAIIEKLFNNPEALENYVSSKAVVGELVNNVLHNDFTFRSLASMATPDYYTHTHSLNVAVYAICLGSYLKMDKISLSELGEAALLHDLGKSKIDPNIVNKNGSLNKKEFETMMTHPLLGYSLGLKIGIKNQKILSGIKHHHEKINGTGYPSGLAGISIPLYARIIGICDIFDAISCKRSYKEALTTYDTLKLMKSHMKSHIDPSLLNSMMLMFK